MVCGLFKLRRDYSVGGALLMDRAFTTAGNYFYSFNGAERDDEVKGAGNSLDYGARMYNPSLGRFLSVDPISRDYPWYTPYQFAGNMPIRAIDIDGLEPGLPLIMLQQPGREVENLKRNYNVITSTKIGKGIVNTTFGLLGVAGSITFMVGTGGVGAALGGGVALQLSLGEVGIGLAQITGAFAANDNASDNATSALYNSSSLPGLVGYGTGSEYASYLDALGSILPAFATAGAGFNVSAFAKDALGVVSAAKKVVQSPTAVNLLNTIDAALDATNFVVEYIKVQNSTPSPLAPGNVMQTLSAKVSYTVKKGDTLYGIAKSLNTSVE
jgi:RHS repeat-associated protein